MYETLTDNIKILVVENLKEFFNNKGLEITIIAEKYKEMIDENVMGISRMFPKTLKKLPFVVVSTVAGKEQLVGFGGNKVCVDKHVQIDSKVGPFDIRSRRFAMFRDRGKSFVIDAYDVLFNVPATVSANELEQVFKTQLPSEWWIGVVSNKIRLYADSYQIEVVQCSSELGFTVGVYTATDYRLIRSIGQSVSVSIDIGAESELVRSQITDLLLFWAYTLRVNILRLVDSNNAFEAFLSGEVSIGGEAEISLGGGDSFFWLYTNRVTVPLISYAYTGDEVLKKIDGVLPIL